MGFHFTVIYNIAIITIFAKVAMYFNKWWIALFGLLAIASYKETRENAKNDLHEEDKTDGGTEE